VTAPVLFEVPEVAPPAIRTAGDRERKMPARVAKAAEPVVVFRVVWPGLALAAVDADQPPGRTPLAVAFRDSSGWSVSTALGRVVGERLSEQKAKALMLRTAQSVANSLAVRLLLEQAAVA
jgi:hypothetical protein